MTYTINFSPQQLLTMEEIMSYLCKKSFNMLRFLLLSISLFFIQSLYAQVWEDNLRKTISSPSIEDKINAFNKHRESMPYEKGNGYKPYARELDFVEKRVSNDRTFPHLALYNEWIKEKGKSEKASNSNWKPLGPTNVPIILSNGKNRGVGRINAIAFDPYDQNIIYIGSPGGGFWKSIDGGANWMTTSDDLPVLGVSSIAVDPSNTDIIYIATGDANASDTYSIGVLKSVDQGDTWTTTGLSYNVNANKRVNKILINPNNTDSVFAATNTNIMLSVDGGMSWNNCAPLGRWRDIEFMPGNPNIVYAAKQSSGGSNVYRSLDGGSNWSVINNGVASSGKYRPLIAVTPINPNVIYALYSASDYSFHGIYKSIDGGDNWNLQSNSPNILGRDTDGTGTGGQSWYDLSLGVSNNDENHLFVGGINLWESTDGGANWTIEASSGNGNYAYMHVDQHCLEFHPITNVPYAGNDGGLYKYLDNLNNWIDISDGLEISQFYKLGLSESNASRLIAGAQDNGTEMLTNGVWDAVRGADGMECAIDPYDEDLLYSSSQYGGLRKSYNGGNNWDNIKPVSYDGAWVTPYKIHPNNNNMIVAGYDEVYLSLTSGAVWDSISYNVSGGQSVRTIALAPSNEDYIYAATYSRLMKTTNSGQSWASIKPGLPNYNISDVTISDNDPNRLWVTMSEYSASNKVFESSNGGATWTNITGTNLPNLPVNCIVYQANAYEDLYIGTDIGVYHKDNTMSDWTAYKNGLPNVVVNELEIHYPTSRIRAATFGRGVWDSPLNSSSTYTNSEIVNNLNIYPNPASNQLYVKLKSTDLVHFEIRSISGRIIKEGALVSNNYIDVSKINSGTYIIKIIVGNSLYRQKISITQNSR
ncbi:MAG: T9SS C-terminal target domain-containing protein [Flavobacteriales bacterium TMED84]|nr:MAG: T9SS C-terminal target domain-containing protein [Flavobacteriales bacterium TMED84]